MRLEYMCPIGTWPVGTWRRLARLSVADLLDAAADAIMAHLAARPPEDLIANGVAVSGSITIASTISDAPPAPHHNRRDDMTHARALSEDIHDQIEALISTVEKSIRQAGDRTEDAASRAAFSVMQAARSLSHEARLSGRRAATDAKRAVGEHPVAATAALVAAIAAIAGAVSLATRHEEPVDPT